MENSCLVIIDESINIDEDDFQIYVCRSLRSVLTDYEKYNIKRYYVSKVTPFQKRFFWSMKNLCQTLYGNSIEVLPVEFDEMNEESRYMISFVRNRFTYAAKVVSAETAQGKNVTDLYKMAQKDKLLKEEDTLTFVSI